VYLRIFKCVTLPMERVVRILDHRMLVIMLNHPCIRSQATSCIHEQHDTCAPQRGVGVRREINMYKPCELLRYQVLVLTNRCIGKTSGK